MNYETVPCDLKRFFCFVFITADNMSCIHIKQQMLGVNENSACTFHIRWNEWVKFQGQLKRLYRWRLIKTAYFSIFRGGFQNILWQPYVELQRQA